MTQEEFTTEQLQEQLIMLRASMISILERERAATIKAGKYAKLLETLLKLGNGPVYSSLHNQTKGHVADFLVEHHDELLDLFTHPLARKMSVPLSDEEKHDALRDQVQKLEKELELTQRERIKATDRARALAETMADFLARVHPAAAVQIGQLVPAGQTVADALLDRNVRSPLNAVESPAKEKPAKKQSAQQSRPPQPAPEKPGIPSAPDQPAKAEPGRVDDTDVDRNGLSPKRIDLIRILGESGEFLTPTILSQVMRLPWASRWSEDSLKTFITDTTSALKEINLVEAKELDLSVPKPFVSNIGSQVIALTPAGQAFYSEQFGSGPTDRLTPFVAKYRTVEAGLLIRLTRQIVEGWNARPDKKWIATVIDAVWEDEAAFDRIPGTHKSYHAPNGKGYAQPDLILEIKPALGDARAWLAVVEVERGFYTLPDLHAKWERAIRCYPPMVTFVVAPNQEKRMYLYKEWKDVCAVLEEREGFAVDVNALFYTLNELEQFGLLTVDRVKSMSSRQKKIREERAARKKEGQKPDAAEEPLPSLPRLWNRPKKKGSRNVE